MQIGVFFDNVREAYPDITDELILLGKVRELGYSYIELDLSVLAEKSSAFFEKAGELSLGFSVYAFADENCVLPDGRPAWEYLSFLAKHNISNLMMVCRPRKPNNKCGEDVNTSIISSLNSLCEKAGEYGVTVLVEDFDSNDIPCGSCEDMLYFAQNVPLLRFTLDTGNFAFFGEDLSECYGKLKDRVSHVHLKDRVSRNDLTVTVTGKGGLPVSEIIDRLTADDYDGCLSVEMFGASCPEGLKEAYAFVSGRTQQL